MLNCPYQYYAVHCLKLAEREQLSVDLEKSDYGQRAHRILQAFHGGIAGLPGPFTKTLSLETYHEAETLLLEISHAVFREDIKRNFFAKGFLYRWLKIVPAYLEWQMQRAQSWKFIATESEEHYKELKEVNLVLTGRIDRLDHNSAGYSIIDYKTGAIPPLEEVESGEHIQLPFYTVLLEEPAQEALFLAFTQEGIKDTVRVEGAALRALSRRMEARLVTIHRSLSAGRPLPAWGDEQTCAQCAMEGLCRKEMWRTEPLQ
jgi:ATP-dependent helicase/nuclease subunit B